MFLVDASIDLVEVEASVVVKCVSKSLLEKETILVISSCVVNLVPAVPTHHHKVCARNSFFL